MARLIRLLRPGRDQCVARVRMRPEGPALDRSRHQSLAYAAIAALVAVRRARRRPDVRRRRGGYKVKATFQNAGQLVKGNQVEVGGRPIGKVKSIELDENGQAEVEIEVGEGFDPLHEGTTADDPRDVAVGDRQPLRRAAPRARTAPRDRRRRRRSRADKTQAPVDLDQLFNTLDPKTRKGLQDVVQGSARRSTTASPSRRTTPRSSTSTRRCRPARALDARARPRPRRRSSASSRTRPQTVTAVAERRDDLAGARAATPTPPPRRSATRTSRSPARSACCPSTLRRANTTFVNLRATLDDLDVLVDESKPATKDLAPFRARCARWCATRARRSTTCAC